MDAVQIFDLQNNEILSFPFGEDQRGSELLQNGSGTPEPSRAVESPIVADMNQSRRADEVEPSSAARQPRTSRLVFVLLAVTLVETTYLGIHAVGERRRVAAADVTTPQASLVPRPPAVAPAIAIEAASTAGSIEDDRSQALDVGGQAPPPLPIARPVPSSTAHTAPPVPVEPPGGISITLPIQLQIFEGGRYVGTNDRERIPLASGRHQLELVNESLGYRSTETVNVPSGKVVPLVVSLPSGTLNINAQPWSDVLIDGEPAGQTPLGNVRLPIGPHEIVFRHPQLGTQKRAVVVAAGAATRVAVDLRR